MEEVGHEGVVKGVDTSPAPEVATVRNSGLDDMKVWREEALKE
jgi:hypothetical protein